MAVSAHGLCAGSAEKKLSRGDAGRAEGRWFHRQISGLTLPPFICGEVLHPAAHLAFEGEIGFAKLRLQIFFFPQDNAEVQDQ